MAGQGRATPTVGVHRQESAQISAGLEAAAIDQPGQESRGELLVSAPLQARCPLPRSPGQVLSPHCDHAVRGAGRGHRGASARLRGLLQRLHRLPARVVRRQLARELVAGAETRPDQHWPAQAIDALFALNTAAHAARD